MANDKRETVPLVSPDFEDLRENLKEYLKQQPEFADYDFDGSTMATLLDGLAYNSYINAFYLNMVGNESFLSTAVKRDSVVERARQLGYTPRSAQSAVATVWIEFFTDSQNVSYIDVPRGSQFTASDANNDFTFTVLEDIRVDATGEGKFIIPELSITEGRYLTHRFTVDSENEGKLVIPNVNVDTDTIRVRVDRAGSTGGYETYFKAIDISDLNADSNAFFINETYGGKYEIEFGDDIISRSVPNGSDVKIDYIVSSGESANGIGTFSLASDITNVSSYDLQVVSAAVGGRKPESIESVKFTAPKHWEAQGRAVTRTDYENILRENYANLSDITVWGGEDNDPPKYGFVFISIRPRTGYFLTDVERAKVKDILKKNNVVSIQPQIVDADFTIVNISADVYYRADDTEKSSSGIRADVESAIEDYDENVIGKFDRTLRFSVLSRAIDTAEPSIVSNNLRTSLEKRVFPDLNVSRTYDIDFNVALEKESISSTTFTFFNKVNCFVAETAGADGQLSIYQNVGSNDRVVVAKNIGTVDYDTGEISLKDIEIDAITQIPRNFDSDNGQYFIGITADTPDMDVSPSNQQIINIGRKDITVHRLTN